MTSGLWLVSWTIGATLLGPPPTEEPWFSASDGQWNALGYLGVTATEARVELVTLVPGKDRFDWSTLPSGGDERPVLLFLGSRRIDADALTDFLDDGGDVIVAVDVAPPDAALEALGLRVSPEGVAHDRFHREHPAFPELTRPRELTSDEQRFLWYNVESIVLNHPVALVIDTARDARRRGGPATPLASYSEPERHAAVEVRRGAGIALILADASLFIDEMQQRSYGDKQLVANALRYHCAEPPCRGAQPCPPRPCRVIVIPEGVAHIGQYAGTRVTSVASFERFFGRAVDALHALAVDGNSQVGIPLVLRWTTRALTLALAVTVLGVLFVFASPKARARPSVRLWGGEPLDRAAALLRDRHSADYSRPARALLESLARLASGGSAAAFETDRAPLDALPLRVRDAPEPVRDAALRCVEASHRLGGSVASARDLPGATAAMGHDAYQRLLVDVRRVSDHVRRARQPGPRSATPSTPGVHP